ncbi:hypothetical protein KC19_4G099900 [Ceratodon purpureus]|nr:hypothetical protein KC19_4G099900 [Ceratodon purpureus]KAG0579453.1 hypothetical protein KC19_4G099900 [Ceratodon purpureus]KAG0579454.1 hypothetical protein KC19_4G099900 [Ceratodon purpureus]KAG0579455.1 hypothetical protein KC19_4G099900 [Ceratodon purpureus]KAG0579458.1 hypothetical protein KC19_4G099900 [Ceratodon purpureus]
MKTKIINQTTQDVLVVQEPTGSVARLGVNCRPGDLFYYVVDTNATRPELYIKEGDKRIEICSDDLKNFKEIIIYETIEKIPRLRTNKLRKGRIPSQDLDAFNASRTEASSRIGNVKTFYLSLEELSNEVNICPSQFKDHIKTHSKNFMKLTEDYDAVPEYEMYQQFCSGGLSRLIDALDRLLSTLGSIKGLLQACGREWCKLELDLSIPPCEKETLSKFIHLQSELNMREGMNHFLLELAVENLVNCSARLFSPLCFPTKIIGLPVSDQFTLWMIKRLEYRLVWMMSSKGLSQVWACEC